MRQYRIEQIQSIKDFRNRRKTAEFQIWKLVISIAICQGVVLIANWYAAEPISNWYETLKKPSFTPPIWLVGLIWIILYALMGIALYLIWRKSGTDLSVASAMAIFFVQLSLNVLWIFVFFGLRLPLGGIFIIIPLWIFILLTSIKFYLVDRLAGYLMIPYLIWISFTSVLNAFIIRLNQ
jgi:benzodiazapine receptor